MGRGQALLGAGDQTREPTVEGEKSHRTLDGQRDGLLQKRSRAVRMKKEHQVQRKSLKAQFPAHPHSEPSTDLFFLLPVQSQLAEPHQSHL